MKNKPAKPILCAMQVKALAAIALSADTPAKLRPCDAWRVYDAALEMGVVPEVKTLLRTCNASALDAMNQYEGEEIMAAIQKTSASQTSE